MRTKEKRLACKRLGSLSSILPVRHTTTSTTERTPINAQKTVCHGHRLAGWLASLPGHPHDMIGVHQPNTQHVHEREDCARSTDRRTPRPLSSRRGGAVPPSERRPCLRAAALQTQCDPPRQRQRQRQRQRTTTIVGNGDGAAPAVVDVDAAVASRGAPPSRCRRCEDRPFGGSRRRSRQHSHPPRRRRQWSFLAAAFCLVLTLVWCVGIQSMEDGGMRLRTATTMSPRCAARHRNSLLPIRHGRRLI